MTMYFENPLFWKLTSFGIFHFSMSNNRNFEKKNGSVWGGWMETSRGDVDVYAIGCGDGFKGIYLLPNSSSCTH